jgi:hypothetical protein
MTDSTFGSVARVAVAVMAWAAAVASVGIAFYIVVAAVDGGLKIIF